MVSADELGPQSHFRDWLRRFTLTGCAFAAKFGASDEALIFYEIFAELDQLDADEVASFFDLAAERNNVGVLLGPNMRGDDDTATLLRVLSEHHRWTISADLSPARDDAEVGRDGLRRLAFRLDRRAGEHVFPALLADRSR